MRPGAGAYCRSPFLLGAGQRPQGTVVPVSSLPSLWSMWCKNPGTGAGRPEFWGTQWLGDLGLDPSPTWASVSSGGI